MRIYLDVCCLNRPFDDQSQDRIRLESEAVKLVLDLVGKGRHTWVSSEAVEYEVSRHPSEARRERLTMLLEQAGERLLLDDKAAALALAFGEQGVGAMDAWHLALAERWNCEVLLTTDDRLLRRARALHPPLALRVLNPVEWIAEAVK